MHKCSKQPRLIASATRNPSDDESKNPSDDVPRNPGAGACWSSYTRDSCGDNRRSSTELDAVSRSADLTNFSGAAWSAYTRLRVSSGYYPTKFRWVSSRKSSGAHAGRSVRSDYAKSSALNSWSREWWLWTGSGASSRVDGPWSGSCEEPGSKQTTEEKEASSYIESTTEA